MTLLGLIVGITVFCVILWLVRSVIPMDALARKILIIVVAVVFILWLLDGFVGFSFLHQRIR